MHQQKIYQSRPLPPPPPSPPSPESSPFIKEHHVYNLVEDNEDEDEEKNELLVTDSEIIAFRKQFYDSVRSAVKDQNVKAQHWLLSVMTAAEVSSKIPHLIQKVQLPRMHRRYLQVKKLDRVDAYRY